MGYKNYINIMYIYYVHVVQKLFAYGHLKYKNMKLPNEKEHFGIFLRKSCEGYRFIKTN